MVRVAVRDASFEQPKDVSAMAGVVGGRGVRLIAALSSKWGTQPEADGKTVWAEVARQSAT